MITVESAGGDGRHNRPTPSQTYNKFSNYQKIMQDLFQDFLKDLQKLPLDTACFMGAHINQKDEWVVSISSTHGKGSL
ncbi:MAG: hypothetical protein MJZ34_08505 [Paludibacteraceae bacterium]|nr:hypothetical protein [Paludibacteraceae bacterium]